MAIMTLSTKYNQKKMLSIEQILINHLFESLVDQSDLLLVEMGHFAQAVQRGRLVARERKDVVIQIGFYTTNIVNHC